MSLENLETYMYYLNSNKREFKIRNNSWSVCKESKDGTCGVNKGKLAFKNSIELLHNVLLLW